jgi:hypothetical protein
MPPADTPDFDSMSPEEVMAWLETLAKRQGAYEGFTTAADVDVPEIDPSTVTIDEPGYVPYGETPPARPARPAPPPAPPTPAQPPRVEAAPPPAPRVEVPPARPVEPARLPFEEEEQETQLAPASPAAQGLAWLESLAADQGGDFPQIDLSALTTEPAAPAASPLPANPLDWLESLAEGQEAAPPPPPRPAPRPAAPPPPEPASIEDPLAAGVDPMLWLESLARRQGARSEELTTPADLPVPAAPPPAADPAAWLESLASDAGFEEEADDGAPMSDDAIRQALQTGAEIPSDAMAAFLDRQLARQIDAGELSAQALDEDEDEAEPVYDFDPDAPLVPGDIPDWLMAQVQMPSGIEAPEQPPLVDEIMEPPAVQDLPDWLRDEFDEEAVPGLESIFAAEEPAQAASAAFIDPSDPWVEAFEQEAQMPAVDSGVLPDWYTDNLNDPARQAAVDRQARGEAEAEALPPEPHLAPGEPEAVPEWAAAGVTEVFSDIEAEAVPDWLQDQSAAPADVPDWLAETADVAASDIPDWLRDTIAAEESARAEPQPPAPIPAYQPPAPTPAPVPAQQPAASLDLEAVLTSARASARAGDVSAGLAEYEKIIRANTGLEAVVEDLTRLVEQHDDNPAVYRVLGDGLMRQGRLQAALDTYRKALNQL